MAKVIILCGKVGSGKSTYAKQLKEQMGAMILSVDDWMLTVYGKDIPCETHQAMVEKVKAGLFREAIQLLDMQINVIIDFGFWTDQERMAAKKVFESYDIQVHYLKNDEKVLFDRIQKRNLENRNLDYQMTVATQIVLNGRFEEPIEADDVIWIQA